MKLLCSQRRRRLDDVSGNHRRWPALRPCRRIGGTLALALGVAAPFCFPGIGSARRRLLYSAGHGRSLSFSHRCSRRRSSYQRAIRCEGVLFTFEARQLPPKPVAGFLRETPTSPFPCALAHSRLWRVFCSLSRGLFDLSKLIKILLMDL